MTKIKNNETIIKSEQRNAKHVSGTKIQTTIEVTRKDRNTKMSISKKDLGNKITKIAKKTKAKLSWI